MLAKVVEFERNEAPISNLFLKNKLSFENGRNHSTEMMENGLYLSRLKLVVCFLRTILAR